VETWSLLPRCNANRRLASCLTPCSPDQWPVAGEREAVASPPAITRRVERRGVLRPRCKESRSLLIFRQKRWGEGILLIQRTDRQRLAGEGDVLGERSAAQHAAGGTCGLHLLTLGCGRCREHQRSLPPLPACSWSSSRTSPKARAFTMPSRESSWDGWPECWVRPPSRGSKGERLRYTAARVQYAVTWPSTWRCRDDTGMQTCSPAAHLLAARTDGSPLASSVYRNGGVLAKDGDEISHLAPCAPGVQQFG